MAQRDLSEAELRALAFVDERELVRDLLDLLAVPSISGSDAESDLQHRIAKQVRELDLDVDLWPLDLPTLTSDPTWPGWEVPRTEAWGLVAGRGEGTPALVLQGHVDVVPAGDRSQWRTDPFSPTVEGRLVHGRGACDMKAGVAANLAAVRAVRAAGIELPRAFALHFVIGEEDGGTGAFATLRRGHTGEACVITEPTSGTLTTANAGALTFEITVPGRATHASTSYAGVSAFEAFLPVHAALGRLEERRNAEVHRLMGEYPLAYPLSLGTVRCGDWASSVPDLLVAEGRLGVALGEEPDDARAELEEAVAEAALGHLWLRDHPPVVRWTGGQFASGSYDAASPLLDVVAGAHADVTGGPRPRERGAPYGSDLRLYAGAGIPTLHYGPGDVRLAHGPEESVAVDELLAVTETLVLTLLRCCAPS
ncbi:ArgE/DapE family deacylase [Nocardioides panaciterrulae]|uniref:Acetylornithine deacetylase n=1 Tax=Nocardioides panaciterrulae TaxID=661492 RepID=A0A7Y9JAC3_9ACTN|nr:ArgE/DapE family deacylase [Nocardioides panaciterrulae]NYD40194.1 acetylornithine deacetylase [Nocardioides panaciterrulae]